MMDNHIFGFFLLMKLCSLAKRLGIWLRRLSWELPMLLHHNHHHLSMKVPKRALHLGLLFLIMDRLLNFLYVLSFRALVDKKIPIYLIVDSHVCFDFSFRDLAQTRLNLKKAHLRYIHSSFFNHQNYIKFICCSQVFY